MIFLPKGTLVKNWEHFWLAQVGEGVLLTSGGGRQERPPVQHNV